MDFPEASWYASNVPAAIGRLVSTCAATEFPEPGGSQRHVEIDFCASKLWGPGPKWSLWSWIHWDLVCTDVFLLPGVLAWVRQACGTYFDWQRPSSFLLAFKGCVVEPPLLHPKRTVVWYWAYYVSAYCMIIRVDFNVWACLSVAIGRRCWFPIESNLFCREVHLHKMPAKNGVICTIRGYDLWDPLDGFGSHLWYQETSWMAASYRCRWEWFLSGLPADGEGKKTEKKMMVSIIKNRHCYGNVDDVHTRLWLAGLKPDWLLVPDAVPMPWSDRQ